MAVVETVFAMMMIVNGSMDGFMKTDGLSHCLKVKRESERNLSDNRVNTIGEDPTAFKYISKEIVLDNPATSIKILVDAYNNRYTAIRAFYAIGESENFNPIFIPFPGYNNLDEKGQIIDAANNDGLPDIYVPPSSSTGFVEMQNEFKENVFTVDELTSFRAYRIKLIMTSTNQVYAPKMRSLRVIALA